MPTKPHRITHTDWQVNTAVAKALAFSGRTKKAQSPKNTDACHGPSPPLEGTPILILLIAKTNKPAANPRCAVKSKAKNVM